MILIPEASVRKHVENAWQDTIVYCLKLNVFYLVMGRVIVMGHFGNPVLGHVKYAYLHQ